MYLVIHISEVEEQTPPYKQVIQQIFDTGQYIEPRKSNAWLSYLRPHRDGTCITIVFVLWKFVMQGLYRALKFFSA